MSEQGMSLEAGRALTEETNRAWRAYEEARRDLAAERAVRRQLAEAAQDFLDSLAPIHQHALLAALAASDALDKEQS